MGFALSPIDMESTPESAQEISPGNSRRSRRGKELDKTRELAAELVVKLREEEVLDPKEEARRKRHEKYNKKNDGRAAEVKGLTDEQRLRAMLGYGYGEGVDKPEFLFMEYICGCCGTEHKAPHLLDTYYLCRSCQNALREPEMLRKRWKEVPIGCKLEICFATYGDASEPLEAYEVTSLIQASVDEIYYRDRLSIRRTTNLAEWLKVASPPQFSSGDPCPGKNKQLKIRYRMLGVHGQMNVDVMPDNQLPHNFFVLAPQTRRYLRILNASYGHPKGLSPQGRMSVDVTEVVQGMVDWTGGSYLSISYLSSVKNMFGDPCPGYPKDLRIRFEIAGREGEVLCDEMRGFLRQRCQIEYAPTIQPLIFCKQATWGISPTGRKMRLEQITYLTRKIAAIEHRQANGQPPSREEKPLLDKKAALVQEREGLLTAEPIFLDIREKIQRICDKAGRHFLLHKDRFDPNYQFGNPTPGRSKLLEIQLESPGHDSERTTDSTEMTASGHPRNFITNKSNRFIIVCQDQPDGKGVMAETVEFTTDLAAPVISITRATYGFLKDPRFTVDVTTEIQARVVDRKLRIPTDLPLDKIFSKDPSPGIRKQLKVEYVTRGFVGAVRVREVKDQFVSSVELGYPPVPLEDA